MDDRIIEQVWQKGLIVYGNNPSTFRKDVYGSWMQRSEYGNRQSDLGWEIDHIIPSSKGGSDNISNLRPLNWKNNASRQDNIFR